MVNNKLKNNDVYLKKINDIYIDWNKFIITNTNNPLCLKEFIFERTNHYNKNGWICKNFIFLNKGKIIGILPMRFKKDMNQLYGKFLLQPHFSPDFILSKNNEKNIINSFINKAFFKLGCKYLDLSIPFESNNIEVIKSICKKNKIYSKIYEESEHRIIKKEYTWDEYYNNLRNKFRKELRRNERNLSKIGERRVIIYENDEIDSKIIDEVYKIEKRSWKEAYRKRVDSPKDPDVDMIWNASKKVEFSNIPYAWRILFLEINGKKIAYAINLQFKNFSTIIKTSFNNNFKKFSPGAQIINEAVKDLYNRDKIEHIDFLTNLPISRNWSNKVITRSRIILSPQWLIKEGVSLLTKPILGDISLRALIQTRNNMEMKLKVTKEFSKRIR